MITTPIFTRLLTTDEFGKFNAFNSWYGIVTVIISLQLSGGVHQQGLVKFDDKQNEFSSSLQGLTTVMVSVWLVIYISFKDFWNSVFSLSTVQTLAMLLMVQTSAAFHFWANEQRVRYKYRALVIVTVAVSIAKPLLGIILVISSSDKVTARIIGLALVELLAYSYLYVLQMKRGKKFFHAYFWKYAVLFNLPLVPHYLSQTVLNNADRIMIQNIVGDSEAGIYSLAYSVASIMILFNTALSQTMAPWIYQKIKEHKSEEISSIGYTSIIIIAAVNIILMVLAPEVVAIFAPEEYFDAIWIIPPVAMGSLFLYTYDLFAKFAFFYEKTFFVMVISVFGAGLNIILNYIFIGSYGYIAAGYTTLLCYIVYAVGHYLYMLYICRKYNDAVYPYNSKTLLIIALIFIGLGFVILMTYNYPLIRYTVVILFAVLTFVFRKRIKESLMLIIKIRKKKT